MYRHTHTHTHCQRGLLKDVPLDSLGVREEGEGGVDNAEEEEEEEGWVEEEEWDSSLRSSG